MEQTLLLHLFLLVSLSSFSCGMILRNKALIGKMLSEFHAPKERTIDIMRNVLCKNFPNVPCELITKDQALRKLIKKTLGLLNEKQIHWQNITTTTTEEHTTIAAVNSDELSQYLAVENTGYFTNNKAKHNTPKEQRHVTPKSGWKQKLEQGIVEKHAEPQYPIPGRKNIRKYFPHKVKYKDRNDISDSDKSREKSSASEEMLLEDGTLKKVESFSHRKEQSNGLPVWQIDYTKHGDPRIPNFNRDTDQLKGKLVKIGSDPDSSIFKHRNSVLRPNVFIKNSIKRIPHF